MWTKFWGKMKNKQEEVEEQEIEEQEEEEVEEDDSVPGDVYFIAEIHFIDGELINVNAFKVEGEDTCTRFYKDEDEYFFEVMDSQVKYIYYTEYMPMTKSIEYGYHVIKSPKRVKFTPATRNNRLKEVE